uniref:Uncharacterized protein n=1 Tax=Arundo donax TaxID=35708 RepID=A0A0A9A0J2_ARUDO
MFPTPSGRFTGGAINHFKCRSLTILAGNSPRLEQFRRSSITKNCSSPICSGSVILLALIRRYLN